MKNEDRFPGSRIACRRPLAFRLTFGFRHSFGLRHSCFVILAILVAGGIPVWSADSDATDATRQLADTWRGEHRLIDLHQHIDYTPEHLARAVRIMNRVGIGIEVNLSGGTTTHEAGKASEFERNRQLADQLFPGRFVHYMNLDYSGWDQPDFSGLAVKQIEEGHRLGAAGFKEYKRLGLYLRDGAGRLIKIDDPKLDPVWKRCGELGMPVSIHVADPKAFWLPYDAKNERWTELKDHPAWWFGDTNKYPSHTELREALNRVIARHPETTFVCVHFANNAEDLDWVERSLDSHPNMMADLAARIPEIGRHDPEKVRRLFIKHQDRIFFATDFQVYDRLTLGSGGSGPPPTDDDAVSFYEKHWRWLETRDRQFEHMTPIQGDWKIDAVGLPAAVLRKIYFDNARRLLVRSLPLPVLKANRIRKDFRPNGRLDDPAWQIPKPVRVEYLLRDGAARPEIATSVRALWSDHYLYLGYESPFTELTVFDPAERMRERYGLWDRDVVEAFIASDAGNGRHYFEFEVSRLDLELGGQTQKLDWNSGFESAVSVDKNAKVWSMEMRIPLKSLNPAKPAGGTRWSLNLYRHDIAHQAFLAWSPTATSTAHTPERFGHLEFEE
jgi:predicted TIM-barrel fold metal-dependent hydrolase